MSSRPSSAPSAPPAPRRARRSAAETREHVLNIASGLFYWHGIRATGVDTVAAEAQVAPTTLYRVFGSKDDLVRAYLEHNDETYRAWFRSVSAPDVGAPHERIVELFAELVDRVQPEISRGCPYLIALSEYPDPAAPPHRVAAATKAWVREQMRDLTRELAETAPVVDADQLADQLVLLLEGVYASAQALGADGPAIQAPATAEALIRAACR